LKDLVASAAVTIVAIIASVVVDLNDHDATAYLNIALLSGGYAVRSGVYKARKKKK
jgi:hypothetical protein